jgi:hypothetical protein
MAVYCKHLAAAAAGKEEEEEEEKKKEKKKKEKKGGANDALCFCFILIKESNTLSSSIQNLLTECTLTIYAKQDCSPCSM